MRVQFAIAEQRDILVTFLIWNQLCVYRATCLKESLLEYAVKISIVAFMEK